MNPTHDTDGNDFWERQKQDALEIDREDLLAVLNLRFGDVPPGVRNAIGQINDGTKLERLVLVAANVPTFRKFIEELGEGPEAFRMVGEGFNPLPTR